VRPADSRLDCTLTIDRWGVPLRDWRTALAATIPRLMETKEVA
jgi:hypothetical protein